MTLHVSFMITEGPPQVKKINQMKLTNLSQIIPHVVSVTTFISKVFGIVKYFEFPSTTNPIVPLFEVTDDGDDVASESEDSPIVCNAFAIVATDKLPVISRRRNSFSDIRC